MPFAHDLTAPERLETAEYVLRPITVDDAALDHAAVMATRDHLRLWEQSTWPQDGFTVADNRADLERMETRHAAGDAFGYTMVDPDETECLGCVYVFPHDARFLAAAEVTPFGDHRWDEVDAVVYFWVRGSRMDDGLERRLLADLRAWFAGGWRLDRVVFVVSEPFVHQVELLVGTDLEPRFALREPGKPAPYFAFG